MDFLITGKVSRVITNKYKASNYVLLLNDIKCMGESMEQKWIPFDSKRLSNVFYKFSGEELSMYVKGKKGAKDTYSFEKIIDIVDDENGRYESDNTYVDKILSGKNIQDEVKPGDIYFRKINDNDNNTYPFSLGVIYKIDKNEVKMFCNGLAEWWTIEELRGIENIYRIEDINIFKGLVDLAAITSDDALHYMEIYSNEKV
jgi:hypothetical protein